MKCNFKKHLAAQSDFVAAFNKIFKNGDLKDLIATETMNDSLIKLLKSQTSIKN